MLSGPPSPERGGTGVRAAGQSWETCRDKAALLVKPSSTPETAQLLSWLCLEATDLWMWSPLLSSACGDKAGSLPPDSKLRKWTFSVC